MPMTYDSKFYLLLSFKDLAEGIQFASIEKLIEAFAGSEIWKKTQLL